MIVIILTIHVLIVLGLIGVVLMQRSEGGALGMGAGTGGGFMSGRSASNALTRTTSVLAGLFFLTSLSLAILAGEGESEERAIEALTGNEVSTDGEPAAPTADDILESLGGDSPSGGVGVSETPLTEQDILNALGAEAGQSVNGGDGAETGPAETSPESEQSPQ